MKHSFLVCFSFYSLFLVNCAAIQTSIEFADLELVANTQEPVFLRNESSQKLVLVMENPVPEWSDLAVRLANAYEQRGYILTTNREDADLILAINIRGEKDLEKQSARAAQSKTYEAGTGAVTGAGIGYLASSGDPISTVASAVGGMTIGALTDVTVNSWVYKGLIQVKGDVLLLERKPPTRNVSKHNDWWLDQDSILKETNTGVTVRAKQANLTWEKCSHPIGERVFEQLQQLLPSKNRGV